MDPNIAATKIFSTRLTLDTIARLLAHCKKQGIIIWRFVETAVLEKLKKEARK